MDYSRRSLLRGFVASIGVGAMAEDRLNPIIATLSLSVEPGSIVTEAVGTGEWLVALVKQKQGGQRLVALSSPLASPTSSIPLGDGTHFQMSTVDSDAVALFCRNTKDRAVSVRRIQLSSGAITTLPRDASFAPLASAVGEQGIYGFFPDGTVQRAAWTPAVAMIRQSPPVLPGHVDGRSPLGLPMVAMARVDTETIALVDQVEGRVVWLRQSDLTSNLVAISDPAVASGLSHNRKRMAQAAALTQSKAGTRTASLLVVHACASDGRGTLYCLLAPLDPRSGLLVVKLTPAGTTARTRCVWPDRTGLKHQVPAFLCVWREQLAFVYNDGAVVTAKAA